MKQCVLIFFINNFLSDLNPRVNILLAGEIFPLHRQHTKDFYNDTKDSNFKFVCFCMVWVKQQHGHIYQKLIFSGKLPKSKLFSLLLALDHHDTREPKMEWEEHMIYFSDYTIPTQLKWTHLIKFFDGKQ